jgi:antimicrobial peptide system SdpB family protein
MSVVFYNWEKRLETYLSAATPWTNSYGLARSVLALASLLTLVFNPTSQVFRPASGIAESVFCQGLASISAYCLVQENQLEWVRGVSILLLACVVIGWQPRLTAIPHWWIAFSFYVSARAVDGGDQVTAVLTFLLVPVALLDPRSWHWSMQPSQVSQTSEPGSKHAWLNIGRQPLWVLLAKLISFSALAVIRLQIAGIYFHAGTAKMKVEEWVDGTALYYWLSSPYMGAPAYLKPLLDPLLASSMVALLTWAVLALEIALAACLLLPQAVKSRLLVLGILFHLGILVMQGIASFALAMIAALILYLMPHQPAVPKETV